MQLYRVRVEEFGFDTEACLVKRLVLKTWKRVRHLSIMPHPVGLYW